MDGKGEKEKGREKEKKGGVRGEVGRGRSCLSKREMGGNNSGCKQEKLPTACFSGGGWHGLSLTGTEQIIIPGIL